MSRIDQNAFKLEELKQAQSYLVRMMKEQGNGRKLLPVFQALKDKIQSMKSEDDAFEEAMSMAAE
jgi:hypothetical protein